MHDEIDLRLLASTLLKNGWKLLGFTLAVVLVVFLIIRSTDTPQFTSGALIVVTRPVYDSTLILGTTGVDVNTLSLTYAAMIDLAASDAVMYELANTLQPSIRGISVDELKNTLKAGMNTGNSAIELNVTRTNADEAAQIANAWTQIFMTAANKLYDQNTRAVATLQAQLDQAQVEQSAAEQALLDYTAANSQQADASAITNAQSIELERMEQNVELARNAVALTQSKLVEARLALAAEDDSVKLATPAAAATQPNRSNTQAILLISGILAFTLATIVILLRSAQSVQPLPTNSTAVESLDKPA